MNIYLEVFIRTVVAIAVLFILTRLTGAKQISQLTFYDYVSGITIGSIAGAAAVDTDIGLGESMMAIAIFCAIVLIIDLLTNKSIVMRRILTGKPIVIMSEGQILFKGLRRSKFDLSDMLRELRNLGYFDLSEVNSVILETNGKLSVQPKALHAPATAKDLNLQPQEKSIVANVVMDGKIMEGNLEAMDKDKAWLTEQLNNQGITDLKEVAVATLDGNGNLSAYLKNLNKENRSILN